MNGRPGPWPSQSIDAYAAREPGVEAWSEGENQGCTFQADGSRALRLCGSPYAARRPFLPLIKGGRYFTAEVRYLQGDEALRDFDAVKIEGVERGLPGGQAEQTPRPKLDEMPLLRR